MAAWEHVAALTLLCEPLIQLQPLGHSLRSEYPRQSPAPWSHLDQLATGPRSKPTDQAKHKTAAA